VIRSFKHKGLERFFTKGSTAGIQNEHNPMHPGAFIKRVYLEPHDIGSNELARQLKVSAGLVSRLINEKTGVSSEMAGPTCPRKLNNE
jgi:hypothetical protein